VPPAAFRHKFDGLSMTTLVIRDNFIIFVIDRKE